jgi:acyl carrier protein
MEQKEIFEAVKEIFSRTVSNKTELKPETASRDVPSWDSLNHVMFIAEVEKVFGISFDLQDMLEMRTIADICSGVEAQLKSK